MAVSLCKNSNTFQLEAASLNKFPEIFSFQLGISHCQEKGTQEFLNGFS
jgi:hypothetical protein